MKKIPKRLTRKTADGTRYKQAKNISMHDLIRKLGIWEDMHAEGRLTFKRPKKGKGEISDDNDKG